MTENRLARIAWSTAGGLLPVLAYAVVAPGYMGGFRPTLVERPEFPVLACAGLLAAGFLYLVTR